MKPILILSFLCTFVFALSGTIACDTGTATGDGDGDGDRVADILAATGDATNGAALFDADCRTCHGDTGQGGSGPALQGNNDTDEELAEVILNGDGQMPSWASYSDQDIADVIAHVNTL